MSRIAYLASLPLSLTFLFLVLPRVGAGETSPPKWTLNHRIEVIGNITKTAPNEKNGNVLHCDYPPGAQTAEFAVDVSSAHQEWQRKCNTTRAFIQKDFPIDTPRTLWFSVPPEAGGFAPERGIKDITFTPGKNPYRDISIGCVVYAKPPPNEEEDDETGEPEFTADWLTKHANRVRYWHQQDGMPNMAKVLRSFKVALELVRAGTQEKKLIPEEEAQAATGQLVLTGDKQDFAVEIKEEEIKHQYKARDPDGSNTWPKQNLFWWRARAMTDGQDLTNIRGMISFHASLVLESDQATAGFSTVSVGARSTDNGETAIFLLKLAMDVFPGIPDTVKKIHKVFEHMELDEMVVNEASCFAGLGGFAYIRGVGVDHLDISARSDGPTNDDGYAEAEGALGMHVTSLSPDSPPLVLDPGRAIDGVCAIESLALGQIEGGWTSESIHAYVRLGHCGNPVIRCVGQNIRFAPPASADEKE